MTLVLSQGARTARKHHQCFECYRSISPGTQFGFQTNIYDGRVYTLSWHLDCEELGAEWRANAMHDYDDEGFPPLRDEWCDSGEYPSLCDIYRGHFPHVIARMELTDQLREATT